MEKHEHREFLENIRSYTSNMPPQSEWCMLVIAMVGMVIGCTLGYWEFDTVAHPIMSHTLHPYTHTLHPETLHFTHVHPIPLPLACLITLHFTCVHPTPLPLACLIILSSNSDDDNGFS